MDAFSIASELFGGLKLTSGQLGQIRALDYRLLLEQNRLLERRRTDRNGSGVEAATPGPDVLTAAETAALRALITTELLEMLTPEQRAALERE